MKKVLLSLSVLSVFLIISCGSKPAAEEPKPEPPVIEETEQEQTKEDVVTDTESVDNSQLLAPYLSNSSEAFSPVVAKQTGYFSVRKKSHKRLPISILSSTMMISAIVLIIPIFLNLSQLTLLIL